MFHLLTRPRWLARHLVVVGLCTAFILLGRWQLHRGEARQGSIQNYGYALEWPLFGVFVIFGWWKMLQDELHPGGRGKSTRPERVSPWHLPGEDAGPLASRPPEAPAPVPTSAQPAPGAAPPAPRPMATSAPTAPGSISTPVVARLGRPGRDSFPKPLTTADIDPDDAEVIRYNAWLAQLAAAPVDGYRPKASR